MLSDQLLTWAHLLGLAGYFGAQFALIYMLIPAANQAADEQTRKRVLIEGLKFYNPFSIGTLGVLVITGAIRLTDLKAALKFDYFAKVSGPLSTKLLLAFILIFIQTYLTFGLTFRIGRQEEVAAHGDGPPLTVEQLNSMIRRIRTTAWMTIVLTAAVVLVSLRMVSAAAAAVSVRGGGRLGERAASAAACALPREG